MKKVISILLTAALMLGCGIPVSAANSSPGAPAAIETEDDSLPFVLVRGMEFNGLFYDHGTENQRGILGEISVGGVIGTLFKALFTTIIKFNKKAGVQVIIDYAKGILEGYSCDKNGGSLYDVGFYEYPLAVSNYPQAGFENGIGNEYGIIHAAIERYGAENTYYFTYDWRMNPLDVADGINRIVNRAIEESGKSKVNLACASMGGVMTVAYLTKYGCEKLDKCIFLSSTFCGTYVTGDLLQGNVNFGAQEVTTFAKSMTENDSKLSALINVLDKTGAIKLVTKLLGKFVANNKDTVYEQLMLPVFGSMLSLWAIAQPEETQACIDYLFRNHREEYAGLITKINELRDMMLARDDMLRRMSEDGLKISVISTFNRSLIPAYEHAYVSGDGTLESKYMSGGAVIADIGKTLGDDYVAQNPSRLSPDRMADASTCLFPEYTWLIKDAPHVSCNYGTDFSDFLFWLIDYDGRPSVTSSERYPQFMLSSNSQELRTYDSVELYK